MKMDMREKSIFDFFGKCFIRYNTIVVLLMLPFIFLSLVFENSFLTCLQMVDFFLILVNASYIVWKIVVKR